MAKRATLADVAERSGMSRTAVSLALNQVPNSRLSSEAIERIHQAAAELDYRPNPAARSLRVGKTATIAFLSDNVTVTRYASAMIRGLLDVAETEDHTVLIAETGDTPARIGKALKAMLDRRPDAVVFGLMGAKEIDVPKLPSDLPVVLLNSTSPQGHACVLPDEFQGGRDIARTLAEAGHRRVAIIGHDDGLIQNLRSSTTMRDRFAGIFSGLEEAGMEVALRIEGPTWEPPFGYQGMARVLELDEPVTAVIALNDRVAFGAYQALQERGFSVPNDISVVSFDDDDIASYLHPGLTTAAIPYEEMGRSAMTMALAGATFGQRELVPMPLRLRGSVKRV